MLDRSKPYGETIGNSKARFHQDGKVFDCNGNEIKPFSPQALQPEEPKTEEPKRGPGRPKKVSE